MKKLTARIFVFHEECSAPGFKVVKDRLTLLLGANVSGTLKLKPMLVYQSQTPRALKGGNKDMLSVYMFSVRLVGNATSKLGSHKTFSQIGTQVIFALLR